jgi:hypothetical protein
MTLAKTVGVMVLLGVVLFALHAIAGPFFSLGAQRWGPEPRGDKLIGVVEGHLKSADVAGHTLRIASGFLGLDSLSLHVNTNTLIGVHGKLGGFGDLDRGKLVRAVYEVTGDGLVASRVDVLESGSTRELAVIPAQISEDTPAEPPARTAVDTPPPVPEPLASPDEAGPELPERTAARAKSADVVPAARVGEVTKPTPRVLTVSPRRRQQIITEPAASPTPQRAVTPPATSASGGAPAPIPANTAPARREPEDAGAVIDWLLNTSSARGQ